MKISHSRVSPDNNELILTVSISYPDVFLIMIKIFFSNRLKLCVTQALIQRPSSMCSLHCDQLLYLFSLLSFAHPRSKSFTRLLSTSSTHAFLPSLHTLTHTSSHIPTPIHPPHIRTHTHHKLALFSLLRSPQFYASTTPQSYHLFKHTHTPHLLT